MKINKMMKRMVTAFLALAMIVVAIPAQKVEAVTNTRVNVNTTETVELDEDYYSMYSFKAPSDGYFWVEATMIDRGGYSWVDSNLTVLDNNGNQILGTLYINTEEQTVSTSLFASKGGQVFNIKVSSPEAWTITSFKVVYKTTSNWENEFNDSAKTACSLKNKKYKYGTITYDDSYDYYKFKVTKTAKVKITFGPEDVTGNDNYWDVDLINTNNDSVTLFNRTKTLQSTTVYLKKGTYYLRVNDHYNAANVTYKIKYQASAYTVKAPTLKKVTLKVSDSYWNPRLRYLDKISVTTSGHIDGYTVQVAKKKSMSGKYINTNVSRSSYNNYVTSKTIRFSDYTSKCGLKTKKATYYVRVRGFVEDPFGNLIYGKYSNIKKVTK